MQGLKAFLPDPSIGRWAQWRQPVGSAAFSLIGQIHASQPPRRWGIFKI